MKTLSGTSGHGEYVNRTFGWLPKVVAALLMVIQLAACSKPADTTKQPAKPPEPKNQTYRMIGGQSVISLVSSDELEIRQGGENLVCKYTKQDGRLRVVVNALGTTTAKYFNMTPEGLVDEDGDIYYEPGTYEKITVQIELNRQLWAAVESDDPTAIADLISKGAAIETRDGRRTALVMAIEDGKTKAVAALLKLGADGKSARTLAASLGGGWVGERRTSEHDAISAMLLESTTDQPPPALARMNAPFSILAIEISGSEDFMLKLRTVGDRPVGKATISIGDYAFEKDDVTPNPKSYIVWAGYCLADSDNPYNLMARLSLDREAIGYDSNIPAVITLNSAGGHKDEVFFTIPALGARHLYLRSPWNSLEAEGTSVATLFDEIPKDIAERRLQRATLRAQYAVNIIGTWVDQDGDRYQYTTDGTKFERLRSGRQSTEKWTIKDSTLDCGSWQAKILSLDASQYSMKLPSGRIWTATRVSQEVLDAERARDEAIRPLLPGEWRDSDNPNILFVLTSEGKMKGTGVFTGNWSYENGVFTSGGGKHWQVEFINNTSAILKNTNGETWRWERVRVLSPTGHGLAGQETAASDNADKGRKFLQQNASAEGVKTTASGLQYVMLKEGDGAMPSATDTVAVHYRGTTIDGKEFDNSYNRGNPSQFPLNMMIKGWIEGLQLMKVGGKAKFFIPSDLAYGESDPIDAKIGPNETLIYEIQLIEIIPH